MTDNVALPDLPSCFADLIGAKLAGGIHLLYLCVLHTHSIADVCFLFNLGRTPFHQLTGFYQKQYRFTDKAFDAPVTFITTFLRHPDGSQIQPHQAQIVILESFMSGVFDLVISTGRQFGKSTVLGWLAVWYILHFPNRHVYIVAPSLDQACHNLR
jgi:hypothetical protein